MEQVLMERYVQPGGTEITLYLSEIPEGLVGHPYTVERRVNNRWQQRKYGLCYGDACDELRSHRAFERRVRSLPTFLGGAQVI